MLKIEVVVPRLRSHYEKKGRKGRKSQYTVSKSRSTSAPSNVLGIGRHRRRTRPLHPLQRPFLLDLLIRIVHFRLPLPDRLSPAIFVVLLPLVEVHVLLRWRLRGRNGLRRRFWQVWVGFEGEEETLRALAVWCGCYGLDEGVGHVCKVKGSAGGEADEEKKGGQLRVRFEGKLRVTHLHRGLLYRLL